jgi:rod shape-determining protein MreC
MSTNRDDFGIAIRSALLQRGARQKFSLFFLICLSILILFFDNHNSNTIQNVRLALNDGIYRVSSISTAPFKFLSDIGTKITEHFRVYNENKVLHAELEKFKKKDFQLEYLSSQNRKLREVLETTSDKKYNSVLTKVILDKESPFLKSVIINRGSNSKIKKGMPVIDGNYLVGRIVEVNFLSSRVLLLNDLNSKIAATIEPSAVQAILTGSGELMPTLEYLPDEFKSESNNTIFTSGKDGVLLPGIPIGKTVVLENQLKVKLFSDPNQLSFVKVILSNIENLKEF